jgi:hypothetical protein
MKTKIYRVTRDDGATFLVEANNRASAVNHIARSSHTAELASQHDLVAAVRAGVSIQRAGEAETE